MKRPVKERTLPSTIFFRTGAILFYITAVPIRLFVDIPILFAIGYTCAALLGVFGMGAAMFIVATNMDSQLLRQGDEYRKAQQRKKNMKKKKAEETEES